MALEDFRDVRKNGRTTHASVTLDARVIISSQQDKQVVVGFRGNLKIQTKIVPEVRTFLTR